MFEAWHLPYLQRFYHHGFNGETPLVTSPRHLLRHTLRPIDTSGLQLPLKRIQSEDWTALRTVRQLPIGSILERAQELNALIRDPEVRCIMSTIGGSNSNSILPYIDYEGFTNGSKDHHWVF